MPVLTTRAPRFGTSSPSKRPSTAPTRSLGVPVAAVAAVPSFGAKEPKAGLRNSRKVLFSVAPRFPEDVPRKKKPEKKSAETGFAQLETPVYSSFGKQAAAGRPSSSGVVFPTTDRRRVMRSIAAPDVDPWEGGRAKPSKLKRYPSAHFGSQTRFSGKHVLGVNVYASPGPAQHDAMAATLRTKRASARQPAWAKPPKKELRDKSGRPKDMNIYRF